jgi:hypothetical protein
MTKLLGERLLEDQTGNEEYHYDETYKGGSR